MKNKSVVLLHCNFMNNNKCVVLLLVVVEFISIVCIGNLSMMKIQAWWHVSKQLEDTHFMAAVL
jgi:hypothetical protein